MRAHIARVLAVEAPVLLVDEPVANLDPAHQLMIMELLRSYAGEGRCVIAVMHDLTLAARYCGRVVLLREGHVVLIDTPGIDELDGEERAELARRVSRRADVVMMLCDGDLTRPELGALEELCKTQRTVLLVLNKADRYSAEELDLIRLDLTTR